MRVLALSGSLRRASVNAAMLRAAARLAPVGMVVEVFNGLDEVPLFNPDTAEQPTAAVRRLYGAVEQADAVVFASPEYAHGVTGVIKNALDWLVGFEPFAGKPVAVVNTSARAHHADAALRDILTTMAAQIVEPASVTIPLLGAHLDEDGMVASPTVGAGIVHMLLAVQAGVLPGRYPSCTPSLHPDCSPLFC